MKPPWALIPVTRLLFRVHISISSYIKSRLQLLFLSLDIGLGSLQIETSDFPKKLAKQEGREPTDASV